MCSLRDAAASTSGKVAVRKAFVDVWQAMFKASRDLDRELCAVQAAWVLLLLEIVLLEEEKGVSLPVTQGSHAAVFDEYLELAVRLGFPLVHPHFNSVAYAVADAGTDGEDDA
jgi:hypothetical protein